MKTRVLYPAMLVAGILAVVAAVAVNVDHRGADADLAAPGAQLYQTAVDESVKTLIAKKDQGPAAAGEVCKDCGKVHAAPVAPAAGEVCPDCGQIHAQVAPGATPGARAPALGNFKPGATPVTPASPAQAQAAAGEVCPDCGQIHGQVNQAHNHHDHAAIPEGDGDYYYCENCKTYHRRPATLKP